MKFSPIVPGDKPLMYFQYKYIYQKLLGFISMDGVGSTEPGVPYLSRYPEKFYNVYVCPVLRTRVIGRYSSVCNEIENHNIMLKSDLVLEKILGDIEWVV